MICDVLGIFAKNSLKKVAEIFGWYWFFVVPLQPQTGKTGHASPGVCERIEFIEMIAIDKEQ